MSYDLFGTLRDLDMRRMGDDVIPDDDKFNRDMDWLIPRWATAVRDNDGHRHRILRFERDCNEVWRGLRDHPKLRFKLLATIGSGRAGRHEFHRPPAADVVNLKKHEDLVEMLRDVYPDIRGDEIYLWARDATPEEVDDMTAGSGMDAQRVKSVKKSIKALK